MEGESRRQLRSGPLNGERFFREAVERLSPVPVAGATVYGDHHLNPDTAPAPGARFRDAAVLVPIVDQSEPTVILTERTAGLSSHAGQIAFPGGKIDAADADAIAAAIREAEEEIGLPRAFVEPVGYLAPYLTGTGFRITPVVARVRPGFVLALNPAEVAAVFEVPLALLMEEANYRRSSRVWNGIERWFYEIEFEDRYIWGATAGIARALYQRVFFDGENPSL